MKTRGSTGRVKEIEQYYDESKTRTRDYHEFCGKENYLKEEDVNQKGASGSESDACISFGHSLTYESYSAQSQQCNPISKEWSTKFIPLNCNCIKLIRHLSISDGFATSKIYDKRDDFVFDILNFPSLGGDVTHRPSYKIC